MKNFPNYSIKPTGKVYSYSSNRYLKLKLTNAGYYSVVLSHNGTTKTFLVHRLVALEFIENPLNLPEVNHIDGNKLNNNVNNLEWVTAKENTQKAFQNGQRTIAYGEQASQTKFTDDQILQVFRDYKAGLGSYKYLAQQLGTSSDNICNIKAGRKRAYLQAQIQDILQ